MGFPRQEYWSGLPFPSPILILGSESDCLSSPSHCRGGHNSRHGAFSVPDHVPQAVKLDSSPWHVWGMWCLAKRDFCCQSQKPESSQAAVFLLLYAVTQEASDSNLQCRFEQPNKSGNLTTLQHLPSPVTRYTWLKWVRARLVAEMLDWNCGCQQLCSPSNPTNLSEADK